MKRLMFYCLITLFITLNFNTASKAQAVNVADSLALVDLYNNTNGPEWGNHTNWLSGPVSSWYGINVSGTRVSYIDLSSNNMNGSIPSSFGNLTGAEHIDLNFNSLGGNIPESIGNLTAINYLNLDYDQLNGNIPSSIGNLGNIQYLSLYNNELTGEIPASIGNLINVTHIDLSSNKLSGAIPVSIGNLVRIEDLLLGSNNLSGEIPSSIGNLLNLTQLTLYFNQLNGSLPSAIGNLVNLTTLNLYFNQLSGSIPSSIGNLVNLRELNLSYNQLSGSIPSSIGNLTNAVELSLNNNQLNGNLPASMANLTGIYQLYLYNNQLSGRIPAFLGNLVNLFRMDLHNNHFSDTIPASLGNLLNLNILDLSFNELTGEIPFSFIKIRRNYYFNLSHNRLRQKSNPTFNVTPTTNKFVDVSYNRTTFNGLEYLAQAISPKKVLYGGQEVLPLHINGNILSVYAGGTLSNNTYKWYNIEQHTNIVIKGDSTYQPTQSGRYFAVITNAIAQNAYLITDTINYTFQASTNNKNLTTNKQAAFAFSVFPNPATNILYVQTSGNTPVKVFNEAGKTLIATSINGNGKINVGKLANGVYYLQNETTGETQKIIISR